MPTLGFCTGPLTTPVVTTHLDVDTNLYGAAEGFSLGAPSFEGGRGSVGAEDGDREARFTVVLRGTYQTVAAAQQGIVRELLKARNWLAVQFPGRDAMFLRTYRAPLDALVWEQSDFGVWELPVTLLCDPWLYGPQETVGPITITNDPASGTNPAWYKFTAGSIKGDAPAPLRVEVDPSIVWGDQEPMIATAALDSSESPTGPLFTQTGSLVAGTDTTASSADATYSGGSKSAVTFATVATMASRLTGSLSATPDPGTYKALLRVGRSDAASKFDVMMGVRADLSGYVYPHPKVSYAPTAAVSNVATWLDLGDFTWPHGAAGLTLADAAAAPQTMEVDIQASRVSGTGNLEPDVLMLVPVRTSTTVSTRILMSSFGTLPSSGSLVAVWDSDNRRVVTYVTGALQSIRAPLMSGGWPELVPGATNLFQLLQSATLTPGGSDAITYTAVVTFKYYPRYSQLRPDAD